MGWTWRNYRIEYADSSGQIYVKLFYANGETAAEKQLRKICPRAEILKVVVE